MAASAKPTARLVVSQRLTAETVRSGYFPIPDSSVLQALEFRGHTILLIEALNEGQPHIVGSAIMRSITAQSPTSTGLVLDQLRLFADPIPMPAGEDLDVALDAVPEGYAEQLLTQLAATEDPEGQEFFAAPGPELAGKVLRACGSVCCLTRISLSSYQPAEVVPPVLPEIFGGTAMPGNLIATLPHLHRLITTGAIGFRDDGALLLVLRQLALAFSWSWHPASA